MRPLLLSIFNIALLYVLAASPRTYGQVQIPPIPEIHSEFGVWPREIPVGSRDTMLQVRGNGFVAESVIQLNGEDIPTSYNRQISLLTGLVPQSFLTTPKSIDVRVLNPYGGVSAPLTIEVKPRRQPATLELELSTISTNQKQVDVAFRLTNEGTESFYVPVSITPFMSGAWLSYQFEVRRPDDSVFTERDRGFLDGIKQKPKTEEELLRSGSMALVRPGESYSGKTRIDVSDFSEVNEDLGLVETPRGQYVIRMRFDSTFLAGAKDFKTKFLSETVLSNSVVLTIN